MTMTNTFMTTLTVEELMQITGGGAKGGFTSAIGYWGSVSEEQELENMRHRDMYKPV